MIRAIDVGFGAVKGVCLAREVEYPSAVGSFRPIRFLTGMEKQDLKGRLCIEYDGKSYFVGDMAYKQSSPRVTMSSDRFTSQEGLALMVSALLLFSNHQYENVKLITGLPVNEYSGLKDIYKKTLQGKHFIKLLKPDGSVDKLYSFNVEDVKVLPQPVGTIFNAVLGNGGQIFNDKMAKGTIAVLDIGKYTVDLALTDSLQFVDKSSVSYSDIGLFDAYKELSLELKNHGYDIPADSLEPYIRNGKKLNGLAELKEQVFTSQAEKIISRVHNIWSDLWNIDRIFITGGGALVLGEHLIKDMDPEKVLICEKPAFTNVRGYFKFAQRLWGS